MVEEIGLFEAIRTQRAIRLYKPDPVPQEMIEAVIEVAIRAPSSGNRQKWGFMVVRDPELKLKIADYYRQNITSGIRSNRPPEDQRMWDQTKYLADHLHEVPVFILACIADDGRPDDFARGATIYPSVQNMLLAARGLGLGSCLTTRHRKFEAKIKELLGMPEDVHIAALLPLGFPEDGARYGPSRRRPASEVTYYDRWGVVAAQSA